jgi:hypothetical protein
MLSRARVGVLLLIVTAGCASFRPADNQPPIEKPIPNPNRIEISNHFGSGMYGGEAITAIWVLEKSGPCRGTITSGRNAGNFGTSVTDYELPPETFEECRALLESTQFFRLKVPRPQFLFEASCWGITAQFDGRKNSVDVYTSDAPAGFAMLREFLNDLPRRGKVIATTGPTP